MVTKWHAQRKNAEKQISDIEQNIDKFGIISFVSSDTPLCCCGMCEIAFLFAVGSVQILPGTVLC